LKSTHAAKGVRSSLDHLTLRELSATCPTYLRGQLSDQLRHVLVLFLKLSHTLEVLFHSVYQLSNMNCKPLLVLRATCSLQKTKHDKLYQLVSLRAVPHLQLRTNGSHINGTLALVPIEPPPILQKLVGYYALSLSNNELHVRTIQLVCLCRLHSSLLRSLLFHPVPKDIIIKFFQNLLDK
jgi:hypothetical protein